MVQRQDVEFAAEGDVTLRGWVFVPEGPGPHPGITMAHGYAGVREHGLERFARVFAEAGFVVLVHDHRGFGASDGKPRFDVDPWLQIADWRRAISYLENRPEVNPRRIGLWGTSYAGGHAIVLGATDRRLRAVVAQVPTISGYQQSLRRTASDTLRTTMMPSALRATRVTTRRLWRVFSRRRVGGSGTRPAFPTRYWRLLGVRPLSANGAKTRPRHRLSPEPLTEAIAQRAGEPEFGAALRCLAVSSAYWAGHPEVNA
jgi:alpha-beta hydrolase superfamily lysophospholipase